MFHFSVFVFQMHESIKRLCDGILAAGGRLLVWSHRRRYDETPIKLCIVDAEVLWSLGNDFGKLLADVLEDAIPTSADAGVAKLLQYEHVFSLLTSIDDEYYAFVFRPPTWPQSLERTTGEGYYTAQRFTAAAYQLEDQAARFERQERLPCTDGDAAVAP